MGGDSSSTLSSLNAVSDKDKDHPVVYDFCPFACKGLISDTECFRVTTPHGGSARLIPARVFSLGSEIYTPPSVALTTQGPKLLCTAVADPRGALGARPPCPKISSKSCSFQEILREKPLFRANFGLSPPWGQNSTGPP